MSNAIKTIRTYAGLFQAQSAKALLENEGIPVFLKNEHVASLNIFYVRALNSVELQVEEEHGSRALEILGAETDNREEVARISKEVGRLFRYSLGIGLLAGIAWVGIQGFETESMTGFFGIVGFTVIVSMIALSLLFPGKA